jgi:hypothetical protein
MNIIRCLHESQFFDIKRGTYHPDSVVVYYGFDTYNASVENIRKLIEIVKAENPSVPENEMHVAFITRAQSIRHAHFTMISVAINPYDVKARLFEDYTIL